MKQVLNKDFEQIYPELEKVYHHSKKVYKLWNKTARKRFITENWLKKVEQYWKYGYISP